jgi:general stress protein YciG
MGMPLADAQDHHCSQGVPMPPDTRTSSAPQATPRRAPRGFAAMDPQRQREIASLGGRAAHQSGHAHEFTPEEARAAGRKRHQRPAGARGGNRPS